MSNQAAWIIRILFGLLIIFLIVEVVLGLRTLINKQSPLSQGAPGVLQPISGGKIALVADKSSYQVGDDINVAVRVSTGGHNTDGTDLIVKFDPNFLEATRSGVTKGSIYTDFPNISFSKDRIALSGISTNQGFNGAGNLVTLKFKAKQLGKSTLTVDFTPNSTTDSNIIESKTGKDILDGVNNLEININGTASQSNISCSSRSYATCIDSSEKSGTYWCNNISDGFSCNVGCFKQKTGTLVGCNVI